MQDVAGKRVVIFRGVGGRELLGDTLAARGARVEYAECYRRVRPRVDPAPLLEAWARQRIACDHRHQQRRSAQSAASWSAQRGRPWLRKTPLFVPHPRIAATARELGLAAVVQTAQGDDGLGWQGLQQWFAAHA